MNWHGDHEEGSRLEQQHRHLERRLGFALTDLDLPLDLEARELKALLRASEALTAEPPAKAATGIAETLARVGIQESAGGSAPHLYVVPRRRGPGVSSGKVESGAVSAGAATASLYWRLLEGRYARPAWTIASALALLWGAVRVGLELSLLLNDVHFFC